MPIQVLNRYAENPRQVSWFDQPRLNTAHPLARQLVGLWVPVGGGIKPQKLANLVVPYTDEPIMVNDQAASVPAPDGRLAGNFNASGTGPKYSVTISSNLKINAPLTWMVWFSIAGNNTATNPHIFGCDFNDVDGTPFLCWSFYRTGNTSATAHYNRAGTSTTVVATTNRALDNPGHRQSLALVLDSSGSKPYSSAVLGTTNASAVSTINYSATSRLVIGGPTGSSNNWNGGVLMGALFDASLPAEHILRLHNAPGALTIEAWRAPRFFSFVPAAGGAITGTAAWTEDADTIAATGTESITGTAAWTEANDTIAATGSEVFTGTSAWTEALDTIAATGTESITGTAAWTEAADTLAASGTVGTVTITFTWNDPRKSTAVLSGRRTSTPVLNGVRRSRAVLSGRRISTET